MLIDIGERRVMLTSSDDWATTSIEQRDTTTTVTWASGHVSTFDADFLSLMDAKANRRRWSPRLWDASHAVAEIDHDTFMADGDARINPIWRRDAAIYTLASLDHPKAVKATLELQTFSGVDSTDLLAAFKDDDYLMLELALFF